MNESDNEVSSGLTTPDNPKSSKISSIIDFWFIISGIIVSAVWLTLFVAGLLVDSSYYRVAINYGFADISDWFWAILTFTLSNVAILAFLAGLLGGIISKMRVTGGFTINEKDLRYHKVSIILYESPFISAIRGMFVFVAILFMQYVSSFTDLGSISKNTDQTQTNTEISYTQLYDKLALQIKDSSLLKEVKELGKNQEAVVNNNEKDSMLLNQIFVFKDSLRNLRETTKVDSLLQMKQHLNTKIRMLRRSLKPPSNVDFSGIGISSFSYFKFAIIVSFLAFIFGYDPTRFTSFLGKLPFLGNNKSGNEKSNE
jgi:hypothetical protein